MDATVLAIHFHTAISPPPLLVVASKLGNGEKVGDSVRPPNLIFINIRPTRSGFITSTLGQ